MKKSIFILIAIFAVSCSTYSGHQRGYIVTKNGTKIEFKNAKVTRHFKEFYIFGEDVQYYIQEKNIKEIQFIKN